MNTKAYTFSFPARAWEAWTDTIPDEKNIDAHLQELIARDAVTKTNGNLDEAAHRQLALILNKDENDERH